MASSRAGFWVTGIFWILSAYAGKGLMKRGSGEPPKLGKDVLKCAEQLDGMLHD